MTKRFIFLAVLISGLVLPALATSNRDDDTSRIRASARVFRQIMNAPDNGIPTELLESAKCIAIVPGAKRRRLLSLAGVMERVSPPAEQQMDGALLCF